MDQEIDDCIDKLSKTSLDLSTSIETLEPTLKEDQEHLQFKVFSLQLQLKETEELLEKKKAEAKKTTERLQSSIVEQQSLHERRASLLNRLSELEANDNRNEDTTRRSRALYGDLKKVNQEAREWLQDKPLVLEVVAEAQSLEREIEQLRADLQAAVKDIRRFLEQKNKLETEIKGMADII